MISNDRKMKLNEIDDTRIISKERAEHIAYENFGTLNLSSKWCGAC